ncbi:LPS-assembly protein LptD [Maricaulis sp.]|uniref:LPS-assembly protein LptD n=1 Tax=Maricaulis sp. TaxID=1486257 RepID=UPI003A904877
MASQFSRLAAVLMSSSVLALSPAALAQAPEADDAPVYLEADRLEDLGNGAGFLATGHVRARQSGRTLYADELEYHPELNRIIARGNVVIHGQGPYPQYADEVELDSEMSAGLALGFATMLENNGQMAAAAAIRQSNGGMQLEDAYYTACQLCEDGEAEPTWRLRARQVIQDPDEQMIYYRDARFEVMGVPVLYSPVFAHPDPSAERHSGLLFPGFSVSSRLGFSYQQPYYWAISPSQDITLAPRVMTNVNPLLFTEYRKRFWSGEMAFEGSITHEAEIDSDGDRYGDETWRWHLFGGGQWDINPDWRWGFGIQRASDDLHLRRYDFSEIDRDRGAPIEGGNRRLVSQVYVEGRTRNSYGSLIAADYQSLRENEDDETIPTIAPMFNYERVFNAPGAWGRVKLGGNAVMLERRLGTDYARASVTADWRARWVSASGIVVEPFAYARSDTYSFNDLPATHAESEDSFSRQLALAGTEFSWPFYRAGETVDWIIEPVISAVIASDDPEADRVYNEDSISLDLDESLLFEADRAAGFDLWEPGQRVSYGMRTTAQWGESALASLFLGQSYRLDGDPVFSAGSGLYEDESDYIVAGSIEIAGFEAELQTRLDAMDGDINRVDVGFGYTSDRFTGQISYMEVSDDDGTRSDQREARANFEVRLTDRWSAIGSTVRDLDRDYSRLTTAGFRYADECTELDIVYQREDELIALLGPSESIQIRITLFTLGGMSPD